MTAEILEQARDISQNLSLDKVYHIGSSFAQHRTLKWQPPAEALNRKHVLLSGWSTEWRDGKHWDSEE